MDGVAVTVAVISEDGSVDSFSLRDLDGVAVSEDGSVSLRTADLGFLGEEIFFSSGTMISLTGIIASSSTV